MPMPQSSPFWLSAPAVLVQRQTFFALVCAFFLCGLFATSAASTAPVPAFDTNRVMALDLKISEVDWNKLRYQHREAEFFPEEGKAAPADPYSWFPAEGTMDGTNIGRVEIRK